jgi:hypothetical protein
MLMIKEFHISAGHTFSPRQYESYKIEGSITVVVNDGEDFDDLRAAAQVKLRELLAETYRAQQRKEGR